MKRSTLAVVTIMTVLLTAACDLAVNSESHEKVSWAEVAGRDLNCAVTPQPAPFSPQEYDINGDHIADWFIAMKCPRQDPPQPYQVEIFDGKTQPRSSKPIATLTRSIGDNPSQMIYLDQGCLYFSGATIVIVGQMRPADGGGTTLVTGFHVWQFNRVEGTAALKKIVRMPPGAAGPYLECPPPVRAGRP